MADTYNYSLNASEIVTEALELIRVVSQGNNPNNDDMKSGRRSLNLLIKAWAARFKFLIQHDWDVLNLTQSNYVIDGGDCYECIRNHTSETAYQPTGNKGTGYWISRYDAWVTATNYTLGEIVVGSDSNLYTVSTAHTSTTDDKPITGANYATYWTLNIDITPTAWLVSTVYKSICNVSLDDKIIGIDEIMLRTTSDSTDVQMYPVTMEEYFTFSNKISPGRPTQYFYERRYNTNSMFLYPYPDSATQYLINTSFYCFPKDYNSASDESSFRPEWILALTYNLAKAMHSKFGTLNATEYSQIKIDAKQYLDDALGLDEESGNIQFGITTY